MPDLVHIVEGVAASQAGLCHMLSACGYQIRTYLSADEILSQRPDGACCVVIDTMVPDEAIPDVVGLFSRAGLNLPVIVLADKGDARAGVRAIKAGAEDFFTKPVERDDLVDAVDKAISRHRQISEQESRVCSGRARLERLTRRERQVFDLVVRGKMNKQIAYALGTTERTIKAHRHKVMEKMQTRSVIELVSCAERLGLLAVNSRE